MLEILIYPRAELRRKATPIELKEINDHLRQTAQDMLELMYRSKGIGLAATQIGLPKRMLVIDASEEKKGERIFINPTIVHREGEVEEEEGCLSLPGVWGRVRRAEKIKIIAQNLQGEKLEIEVNGLPSRVWQHEIDHLDGILFIDRMIPEDRLANAVVLTELELAYHSASGGKKLSPA